MSSASMRTAGAPACMVVGSTPSIRPGTSCCTPEPGRGYVPPEPVICGDSESMPRVEGKPIDQVRARWAAYARGGVEAMHREVGDGPVEWIPLGSDEPVPPDQFWGEWGRRQTEQVSVTLHSFEEHGDCV